MDVSKQSTASPYPGLLDRRFERIEIKSTRKYILKQEKVVLGIDSAIAGGSLALIDGSETIASWVGAERVSKAENLLANIDRLLAERSLDVKDLDLIIVSGGPGSFTGIKVGIATAMGLRLALDIQCRSISALEAVAFNINQKQLLTVAVPVGRGFACLQTFRNGVSESEPRLLTASDVIDRLNSNKEQYGVIAAHSNLIEGFTLPGRSEVIDVGMNMASYLCRAAHSSYASTVLKPLFVQSKHSISNAC